MADRSPESDFQGRGMTQGIGNVSNKILSHFWHAQRCVLAVVAETCYFV
jgi:hypothetical protein